MKNRIHDAPVKMIQILPVDNNSSNQPLKPADFSFFKKLIEACRKAIAPAAKDVSVAAAELQLPPPDQAAVAPPIESDPSGQVQEPGLVVQRSDTLEREPVGLMTLDLTMPASEWPDRASDIVVRDIVAIQDQPAPSIDAAPTDQVEQAEKVEMVPSLPPIDMRQRIENAKTTIVAQWLHEKEQIASVETAMRAMVRPVLNTVWRSFLTARIDLTRKRGGATRFIMRRTRHLERRVRKMAIRANILEEKEEERKEEKQNVARELAHELEVTKATLLAQQQALENVTVQLNAVQKELARHKSMLTGLMTQVEAVDLKIVRAIQPPPPRRAKPTADPEQPRRASTKPALDVERSREQRV